MTLEEAANAVRLYVEAKPYDDGRMNKTSWLERLDDCLTDIRLELAEFAAISTPTRGEENAQ